MTALNHEPTIKVGLLTDEQTVRMSLSGGFHLENGPALPDGDYTATLDGERIFLNGDRALDASSSWLAPSDFEKCRLVLHDVTIGIGFHWQRKESQALQGALQLLDVFLLVRRDDVIGLELAFRVDAEPSPALARARHCVAQLATCSVERRGPRRQRKASRAGRSR